MSYVRPPYDTASESWAADTSYTRPLAHAADETWALGEGAVLFVTIAPPAMPATFAGIERPKEPNTLWGRALHRPEHLSASLRGTTVVAGALAVSVGPIFPEPIFRGRERAYSMTFAVPAGPGPHVIVPAFTGTGVMVSVATAEITAGVEPYIIAPTLVGMVRQLLELPDNDGPRLAATWRQGARRAQPFWSRWGDMQRTHTPASAPQTHGIRLTISRTLPHADMLRLRRRRECPHAHGVRLSRALTYKHAHGLPARRRVAERHAHGIALRRIVGAPHAEAIRRRGWLRFEQQQALPLPVPWSLGHHQARTTATPMWFRWAQMIPPAPGRWWPFYEPPPLHFVLPCVPGYVPRPLHCTVLLHWEPIQQPHCPGVDPEPPGPGGPIIVPILARYVVINTFSLVRADTGEPLEAPEFSASLDVDSWTWGWSARVPGSLLDLVRGPPGEYVELIATVNGIPLRLAVERLSRDRRFASSWLRISGRGRAAILADPHAPVITRYNTESRTAQQILDDALTDNGVPIGWAVDWQAVDWTVPAGAWSHVGTYMDAATRLAEAAGAYVQAHDTDELLRVLPRYPEFPWEWTPAGADLVLPEDVCSLEGIEWVDRPAYNAVYISGQEGGRRDRIIRTGSAADRYAPSVIDPLATHEHMTRARGGAILADTGRQAHISVRLPVLQETGIIRPGKLVQYNEQGNSHLGLSRGVSLEHRWPELWQTVRIETHQEAAP